MYNLKSTVNFPTKICDGSGTATDDIFIDLSRNFTINPLINGLSDHNAQLLLIRKRHCTCIKIYIVTLGTLTL